MKIRQGFVSNSSSSCFIVGFTRKPTTVGELYKLMFGNLGKTDRLWGDGTTTFDVATRVFNDLKHQKPMTDSAVHEEVGSGSFDGYPDYNLMTGHADALASMVRRLNPKIENVWETPEWADAYKQATQEDREIWDKAIADAVDKYMESLGDKFEDKELYLFNYSDESGDGTFEHGEIFGRLPHLQISHH